jgi:hypothetical protein
MAKRRRPPSQSWRTFVHNHADAIASIDMFVVPTISFRPNFTRFQIKLLILLDTTHLCSHNISLNFILDVDVGSGFSPNQRRQIRT